MFQRLLICSILKHYISIFRDAPEPTGDEPDDTDFEMPKIYEPVSRLLNVLSFLVHIVRIVGRTVTEIVSYLLTLPHHGGEYHIFGENYYINNTHKLFLWLKELSMGENLPCMNCSCG